MPVRVVKVNLNTKLKCTLYIGREWGGMPLSPFHSPFHIGKDGTREEVIAKFAAYWYDPEQWRLRKAADIAIDDDEILGCWCHPEKCHGDIIAGYLNARRNGVFDACLFDYQSNQR
jgi:hypothetical protein